MVGEGWVGGDAVTMGTSQREPSLRCSSGPAARRRMRRWLIDRAIRRCQAGGYHPGLRWILSSAVSPIHTQQDVSVCVCVSAGGLLADATCLCKCVSVCSQNHILWLEIWLECRLQKPIV